jgi:hypothetical protein
LLNLYQNATWTFSKQNNTMAIMFKKFCCPLVRKKQTNINMAFGGNKPRKGYKTLSTLSYITVNVPVVFMARYVMVLRGATSLRGALDGVGPENRDFFGP